MNRKKIRFAYNIIMIMLVLYAWLIMFFNAEEGMLTSKGFTNLKYYTTLSNIFAAVVALMWVYDYVKKKDASYMPALKLVAAAAVGVRFWWYSDSSDHYMDFRPCIRDRTFSFIWWSPLWQWLR